MRNIISISEYISNSKLGTILSNPKNNFNLYIITNAFLFTKGVITTNEGYPLKESTLYQDKLKEYVNELFSNSSINNLETLSDSMYISLVGPWSFNFYHWFFDYLTKIIMAEENGYTGKYILLNDNKPFQKESLEILGIKKERIKFIDVAQNFLIQSLCIPEIIEPNSNKFNRILNILRSKFINQINDCKKDTNKIFISRKNATNGRKIVNENEVINLISKYGFEVVETEKLSLTEQINLFSNTDYLIGSHGAGMIHSLFMPQKSNIIELFSPVYINYCCTQNSVSILKHNYYSIVSECFEKYKYGSNHESDVYVPLKILENTLDVTLKNNIGI